MWFLSPPWLVFSAVGWFLASTQYERGFMQGFCWGAGLTHLAVAFALVALDIKP